MRSFHLFIRLRRRTVIASALLLVFSALGAGCELPPSHQQQVEMRERGFERGVYYLDQLEEGRLDNMGRTLSMLEDRYQEDIATTQKNGERVNKWLQDDFDNWNRSLPLHEERFKEYMKGRPESAERVLPLILY